MRSCIYCGRELKDGEVCSCPRSQARRAAKSANNNAYTAHSENGSEQGSNYYRTGYTKNDGRIKRRWHKFKTQRAERRNRRSYKPSSFLRDIGGFIKSPVNAISNPKDLSMALMLLIAAIQGAIIGLGIFFTATGASRSWFRMLANIIGFSGFTGYKAIAYIASSAIGGAVGGIMMFLIHSAVFYVIGKLLFRSRANFSSFSQRLVLTNIPFTVFAAVGVSFSFISTTTLMILLLCGVMTSFILTYVSLCCEWSAHSESKVLYALVIGYFILFTLICTLLRISVLGG